MVKTTPKSKHSLNIVSLVHPPEEQLISQAQSFTTRLIPVPQWSEYHSWPKIGGLRMIIFNEETNGCKEFGVFKRVGRRVLVDEAMFFKWVEWLNSPEGQKAKK